MDVSGAEERKEKKERERVLEGILCSAVISCINCFSFLSFAFQHSVLLSP